jgi:hypothetical protein
MKKFKNLPAYFVGKTPTDQEILDAVMEMCTEPVSNNADFIIKDLGAEGRYYPRACVHPCYIGSAKVSIYRLSPRPGTDFPMFYEVKIIR